mgnify:CR=1 FL=1
MHGASKGWSIVDVSGGERAQRTVAPDSARTYFFAEETEVVNPAEGIMNELSCKPSTRTEERE